MTALLLAATPLAPLLLLAALVFPASRERALALAWIAPLPGLACALLAAGAEPFVFYAHLRLTLALDAPSALLLGAAALLWCGASAYARATMPREDALRFAAWWLPTMAGAASASSSPPTSARSTWSMRSPACLPGASSSTTAPRAPGAPAPPTSC